MFFVSPTFPSLPYASLIPFNRYLVQSLIANLFYCLPWAIVLSKIHIDAEDAWTYHALIFVRHLVSLLNVYIPRSLILSFILTGRKFGCYLCYHPSCGYALGFPLQGGEVQGLMKAVLFGFSAVISSDLG